MSRTVRRQPVRTCVACRTSGDKRGLLRVVRLPEDAGVIFDATGKANGRGAYVCASAVCIEAARKRKAFSRSLKTETPDSVFAVLLEHAQPSP
jgi:predicted RNA-binding protein YlxR (DUF448 family)